MNYCLQNIKFIYYFTCNMSELFPEIRGINYELKVKKQNINFTLEGRQQILRKQQKQLTKQSTQKLRLHNDHLQNILKIDVLPCLKRKIKGYCQLESQKQQTNIDSRSTKRQTLHQNYAHLHQKTQKKFKIKLVKNNSHQLNILSDIKNNQQIIFSQNTKQYKANFFKEKQTPRKNVSLQKQVNIINPSESIEGSKIIISNQKFRMKKKSTVQTNRKISNVISNNEAKVKIKNQFSSIAKEKYQDCFQRKNIQSVKVKLAPDEVTNRISQELSSNQHPSNQSDIEKNQINIKQMKIVKNKKQKDEMKQFILKTLMKAKAEGTCLVIHKGTAQIYNSPKSISPEQHKSQAGFSEQPRISNEHQNIRRKQAQIFNRSNKKIHLDSQKAQLKLSSVHDKKFVKMAREYQQKKKPQGFIHEQIPQIIIEQPTEKLQTKNLDIIEEEIQDLSMKR